jgi:hypothetical protein
MIEYIYDAIRATHGDDIEIAVKITESDGSVMASGSFIEVYDNDNHIVAFGEAEFNGEVYNFVIPALENTGRYFYVIKDVMGEALSFKQPLYVV